jgi:hypothetical protein
MGIDVGLRWKGRRDPAQGSLLLVLYEKSGLFSGRKIASFLLF